MSTAWKPGDLAMLKSGGPLMTVRDVVTPTSVVCIWFGEDEHLKEGSFPIETLDEVSEADDDEIEDGEVH